MNDTAAKNWQTTLSEKGWVVIPHAFTQAAALAAYAKNLNTSIMQQAGVGRADGFQQALDIRSDKILWLQEEADPVVTAYLAQMEYLRQALNEQFFLGLFDYECHFSHYAPGAFYQKHRDAFADAKHLNRKRKLSSVFYLNDSWQPGDGGELVLYDPHTEVEIIRIVPELGTLVLFLSEEFPHEVLPVNKSRWSLTGWFRSRGDF